MSHFYKQRFHFFPAFIPIIYAIYTKNKLRRFNKYSSVGIEFSQEQK